MRTSLRPGLSVLKLETAGFVAVAPVFANKTAAPAVAGPHIWRAALGERETFGDDDRRGDHRRLLTRVMSLNSEVVFTGGPTLQSLEAPLFE